MTDLAHDYLDLDGLFSAEELALRDRVRAFVRDRIKPNIAEWYESAQFSRDLAREMGALGLLGMHLSGYAAPGEARSSTASRRWSSRPATPGCGPSSASRGR